MVVLQAIYDFLLMEISEHQVMFVLMAALLAKVLFEYLVNLLN